MNDVSSSSSEPNDGKILSYWVFQFKPGEGNQVVESGGAGTRVEWRLTAYKDSVRAGDTVFFWRASGPDSALIGWGEISGESFQSVDENVERIPVTTRVLFDSPIAKQEIEGHPVLATIGVFSGRQGTNFRLSIEQAAALADLMKSRGLRHPEINLEALSSNLRARIERGAGDLAKLAEGLPDPALREELLSTVRGVLDDQDSAGSKGIGERIRAASKKIVSLQREGKWTSRANVDSIALQVADDVEHLQNLGPRVIAPKTAALGINSSPASVDKTTGAPEPTPASPSPPPPSAPPPQIAPKDHWYTTWEKQDLVGIRQHVSNLARYISHQELVPPRAIGIFGDWGSGKSFFLRALRSEIALYASQSRDARAAERRTTFCGHVVQIEFNAWHYVESNLWASIAGYVFEQLYNELQDSTQANTADAQLDALYKSLDIYKEAVAERDHLVNEAGILTANRVDIEQQVKNKRLDREQLVCGLYTAAKQAAQQAFENIPNDAKQKLAEAVPSKQIATAEQAMAEANRILEEGRSTFGKALLATQSWGSGGFFVAAAVVLAVLFGVPVLVGLTIEKILPTFQTWIATLGSYVVLGSAALTWLTGKARTPLGIASRVLEILSGAEEEARSTERARLEALDGELQVLEQKIAATDAQIAEQQRLIAEARDAIDPRNLGAKLKRFLEQRARAKGYEEHLGLITLVRRDFESLSNLMRKHWAQRFEKLPEAIIEADRVIGAKNERVPFIERIVLYIDDLDRCPPQKVVEVLQAVHLMLGFPLFVVVVAVDVRWVRESLLKHYPELLSSAAFVPDPVRSATSNVRAQADDYLEKIFQIPFRIPNLNRAAAEKLISGLLKEPFLTTGANQMTDSIPTLDLTPKELKLYPSEELAINALNRSIGISPRRIRRFLDQYLIMRAGMDDGIVELITKDTNQYQSILGLFAMLSGAANSAPFVLQKLLAELRDSTGGAPIATGLGAWIADNAIAAQPDPYELDALTHAAKYMDTAQPDRVKLSEALVRWIPEVARYSFREIRL